VSKLELGKVSGQELSYTKKIERWEIKSIRSFLFWRGTYYKIIIYFGKGSTAIVGQFFPGFFQHRKF